MRLIRPMLASPGRLSDARDTQFAYEIKWDGIRLITYIEDGKVRAYTRNDREVSRTYPEIDELAAAVGRQAVLDGEVVAFDSGGAVSFSALQHRMHVTDPETVRELMEEIPVVYVLFDLLELEGRSCLRLPYEQRRAMLMDLHIAAPHLQVPSTIEGDAEYALRVSAHMRAEGIVAKGLQSPYLPGRRSPAWIKIKHLRTQEVVIGGWRPGAGRRLGQVGSLLVGVPGRDGLRYAGRVGTGFDTETLNRLTTLLEPLAITEPAFSPAPPTSVSRDAHWVKPQLVGEVSYDRWTGDGVLRHPVWRGLRPDKRPEQVVQEEPIVIESPGRRPDHLAKYRAMRDFNRTREPAGADTPPPSGDLFVVQRHRARRRHYDLRLELDGVLLSWAVPNGPTLDPHARRLAVHVEDHPIEYATFEGVIPAGEYGGGDVIVWDTGTWQHVKDPRAGLEAGNLHFDLYGEKLKGRFVLIRTKKVASGKEQWLLLHKNDEYANPGWDPEEHPRSVKTGRTNEEVAASPDALWRSDMPAAQAEISLREQKGKPVTSTHRKKAVKPPTAQQLVALDELGTNGTWRYAGHDLALTNLTKLLFPARDDHPALTKRDIIRYYASIAPTMLPYLLNRPVNMNRFPNGVEKPGFWHKEAPSHAPDWLTSWRYPEAKSGDVQSYLVPDQAAVLPWLANFGAIELHAWTARIEAFRNPTWVLFDIDPGPATTFDDVLTLARLHRTALDHLGLVARPKVSGQRGIQVWVPITPHYTYEQTRAWAKAVSELIGATVPELISWEWHTKDRRGRARLDYTQNVKNKTLVAPYSLRPRADAPVSVPIEWDELDDPELRPDRWTLHTVLERVEAIGDPFAALLGLEQELPSLDD